MTARTEPLPGHRRRPRAARAADIGRLGLGCFALLRPRAVLAATRTPDRAWPRRTVRLLGARLLVQAVAGTLAPGRRVLLGGAAVELTHAGTMVLLAAVSPAYRPLALTSGAVAAGFGAVDLRALAAAAPAGQRARG